MAFRQKIEGVCLVSCPVYSSSVPKSEVLLFKQHISHGGGWMGEIHTYTHVTVNKSRG